MNHYTALEIETTATAEEIKKAYRRLTLQYHPDRNIGNKTAAQKFTEIALAYEVLSDPHKKQMYDLSFEAPGLGSRHFYNQSRYGYKSEYDFKAHTNPPPFSNNVTQTPPPDNDIYVTAEFTLEEVVAGGDKFVECKRKILCDICHGKNYIHCPHCSNTGRIEIPAQASATLPPGATDGMQFRVRDCGHIALDGTKGDLIITAKLKNHDSFILVNPATGFLRSHIKVNLIDVLLKTKIEIPTLYGTENRVVDIQTLKDQVFYIDGSGLPVWGKEKGDLLVDIEFIVPQKLTSRLRGFLIRAKKILLKDDNHSN